MGAGMRRSLPCASQGLRHLVRLGLCKNECSVEFGYVLARDGAVAERVDEAALNWNGLKQRVSSAPTARRGRRSDEAAACRRCGRASPSI